MEGVKDQETVAEPEKPRSDKELNFRRLEEAREKDREARIKAEMRSEHLEKELIHLKEMLKPVEEDPFDTADDIDPAFKSKLQKKLEKNNAHVLKEAEKIVRSVYQTVREEDYEKSAPQRLRSEFPDFEQVMNEDSILELQKNYPAMTAAFCKVPDEYARKKAAYEFIKSQKKVDTKSEEIKSKVEANMQNPYMIPSGSGTPAGVDFDIKSKPAREAAYQALKAAQRRPIGR